MNSIKDLELEIKQLELSKIDIEEKILNIKNKIILLKNSEKFLNIKINEKNKELFAYYLMENRDLSDKTVHKYYNSLQKIKDLFFELLNIVIPTELYFIDDIIVFKLILDTFKSNNKMINENKKRHNDLSAAINNYYNFLIMLNQIK